jgi:uncharacterized protein YcbX
VITLGALFVYPVKSCRGVELARAEVTPAGVRHDREWMIVTPAGRFLTQRDNPRLALVSPELDDDSLTLTAPGTAPLVVPLDTTGQAVVDVAIWDDRCRAHDAGDTAARWLESWLGRPARLVRFDPSLPRPTDPDWSAGLPGVSLFSDGFPLLVLARASLADLNSRLPVPLPMERFRPSLVLDGCEPYAEDRLHALTAGAVQLRLVKPCTRCVITTTDQRTGQRDGDEPLHTLKTYRWDSALRGVTFGQNAIVAAGAGRMLERGMTCEPAWR